MPTAPDQIIGAITRNPSAPGEVTAEWSAPSPTAPGEVTGEWSAPSPTAPTAITGAITRNPSAPGEITGEWSAPSPTAPAAITGAITRNPSAPGEVTPEWTPPVGAQIVATVAGTLSPDATGVLIPAPAKYPLIYPAAPRWSSNGADIQASVRYTEIYPFGLMIPEAATVDELAPKTYYTPNASMAPAPKVRFLPIIGGLWQAFWLWSNNGGTPRWVLVGDGTLADAGTTEIAAGAMAFSENIVSPPFPGGPLADYAADPDTVWKWLLYHSTGTGTSGNWLADGPAGTPPEDGWEPVSPSTGNPAVSLGYGSGLLPPPPIAP